MIHYGDELLQLINNERVYQKDIQEIKRVPSRVDYERLFNSITDYYKDLQQKKRNRLKKKRY
jgi:hypothetical protein